MSEQPTIVRAARKAKRNGLGIVELFLVLAAVLVPLFVFANKINGDEWIKAACAAFVAAVIYVYKLWRGVQEVKAESE